MLEATSSIQKMIAIMKGQLVNAEIKLSGLQEEMRELRKYRDELETELRRRKREER